MWGSDGVSFVSGRILNIIIMILLLYFRFYLYARANSFEYIFKVACEVGFYVIVGFICLFV